jgi:hypothetical protein
MYKKGDIPTRQEVTDRVDKDRKEMEIKESDLDRIAKDVETVRGTNLSLDFGGTAEGTELLEQALERAERVTEDVFGQENDILEQVQAESELYESKMDDHRNFAESDLGKISNDSARIETKETINALVQAKEALIKDRDFLTEQIHRADKAIERSEAHQRQLEERIQKGKK